MSPRRARILPIWLLSIPFAVCPLTVPAQTNVPFELQMTFSAVPPRLDENPMFRLELKNRSDHALILNVGMMLANGRLQYPMAIHFRLQKGKDQAIPLDLLGPALIAGRIDPLIIELPVDATWSIPVDLTKYAAPSGKIWALSLDPGRYTLVAEYAGSQVSQQQANLDVKGLALMPYWLGTARSAPFKFTLRRHLGKTTN